MTGQTPEEAARRAELTILRDALKALAREFMGAAPERQLEIASEARERMKAASIEGKPAVVFWWGLCREVADEAIMDAAGGMIPQGDDMPEAY